MVLIQSPLIIRMYVHLKHSIQKQYSGECTCMDMYNIMNVQYVCIECDIQNISTDRNILACIYIIHIRIYIYIYIYIYTVCMYAHIHIPYAYKFPWDETFQDFANWQPCLKSLSL